MRNTTMLLVAALALAFPQVGAAQSNSGLDAYQPGNPNVGGNDGGGGGGSDGSSGGSGSGSTDTGGAVGGGTASPSFSGGAGSGGVSSFDSSGGGTAGTGSTGGIGGGGGSDLGVPAADPPDSAEGVAAQAGMMLLGSVLGGSDGASSTPAPDDSGPGLWVFLLIALALAAVAVIAGRVLRARRTQVGQPEPT